MQARSRNNTWLTFEECIGRIAVLAFLLMSYEFLAISLVSFSASSNTIAEQSINLGFSLCLALIATLLFFFATFQEEINRTYTLCIIFAALVFEFALIASNPTSGFAIIYIIYMVFSIPTIFIISLVRKRTLRQRRFTSPNPTSRQTTTSS